MSLYEEQKIILFEGINNLPDTRSIKSISMLVSRKNEIKEKSRDEFVSKALKMRMRKTMEAQKLTLEDIEKEITRFAETQRTLEIKKIDEELKKITNG